jgi:hypothetical protein
MEYVDPYHKRTGFVADSFSWSLEGGDRGIIFAGRGQHESVVLRERCSTVVTIVPEAGCEFVLRKVQILEQPKWLTLDFEHNPLLSRVLIHIDHLDANQLDTALRSLIGTRSLLFYRH